MKNKKLWIWLDPTDFCNLSCKLCYTKSSHAKNFLSFEDFKNIVDKLIDSKNIAVQMLHLNWRGEPLANQRVIDFLSYLNEKNVPFPVHLHTNGTLIDQKIIVSINKIDFRIDFILFFSIDGGSKLLHDLNRGPGTFDKTINGYNQLVTSNPKFAVGIYELIVSPNDSNINDRLSRNPDIHHKVDPIYPDINILSLFSPNKVQQLPLGATNIEVQKQKSPQKPCIFAGNSFAISPNGDVYICLVSHSELGLLGNIHTDTIDLLAEKAEKFRKRLEIYGRSCVDHCKHCMKFEDPIYSK